MPRILKFGTNIRYDKLYCVLTISHIWLISPFLSFSPINFSIISAQHLQVLESSNFVYTMRTTKCITINKTMVLRFIFVFFLFFPFSISHSKVMNIEIFLKDFSGTP